MGVFSFFEGEEFWLIYNVVSPFFPSKKWKEGKEKKIKVNSYLLTTKQAQVRFLRVRFPSGHFFGSNEAVLEVCSSVT